MDIPQTIIQALATSKPAEPCNGAVAVNIHSDTFVPIVPLVIHPSDSNIRSVPMTSMTASNSAKFQFPPTGNPFSGMPSAAQSYYGDRINRIDFRSPGASSSGAVSSVQSNSHSIIRRGRRRHRIPNYREPCGFCNVLGHMGFHCSLFLQWSVAERVRKVTELDLCPRCLWPGVKPCDCKFKNCHCGESHHSTLCSCEPCVSKYRV